MLGTSPRVLGEVLTEVEPLPLHWGGTGLTVILTVKFLPTGMRKKPSNTKSRLLLRRVKVKWVKDQVPKAAQGTDEWVPRGQQSLHPNGLPRKAATLHAALPPGHCDGRESASPQTPCDDATGGRRRPGPRSNNVAARPRG